VAKTINVVYKVNSKELDDLKGKLKGSEQESQKLEKELNDVGKAAKKAGDSGSKSFLSFKNVVGAIGVAALGAALVGLGKKIFDLGVKQEQLNVAFTTFLGSAEKAKRVLADLTKFSIVTPFTPDQVNSAAKALIAFGVESNKLIPTLKFLGDVSAGTGKDLTEMAVIFGQIRSTGRLMGQDLLQLINAGFNPLQQISKDTGKAVGDLKKEMEKGAISFEMVETAFKNATSEGGTFFNLMEKQSATIGGKISTLQGNFEELGKTFFGLASGPVPALVDAFNELLIATNQFFKRGQIDDIVDASLQRFRDSFDEAKKSLEETQSGEKANQLFKDLTTAINEANSELNEVKENLELVSVEPGLASQLGSVELLNTRINVLNGELGGLKAIREEITELFKPKSDNLPKTIEKTADEIRKLKDAMSFLAKEQGDVNLDQTPYDPMFKDALKRLDEFGNLFDAEQKQQNDERYNLELEAAQKRTKIADEEEANKQAAIRRTHDLAIQLAAEFLATTLMQRQEDTQSIRDKYDQELLLAGDNDKAKEKIEIERDKKLRAAELKNKEIQKKNARTKILIDTAVSIIKTMSEFGYPAGLIPAALMAAMGALALKNVGKYKDGGWIEGRGTETSDSVPIMASKNEFMVKASAARNAPNLLEAINDRKIDDRILSGVAASGGSQAVAIDYERLGEEFRKGKESYDIHGYTVMKGIQKGKNFKQFIRSKVQGY
jgi:tape measure domain-containing protein